MSAGLRGIGGDFLGDELDRNTTFEQRSGSVSRMISPDPGPEETNPADEYADYQGQVRSGLSFAR
jgi:hypothetical protein